MLSVVMIAYNKAAEIPLVLRGLASQAGYPGEWELVLVDDGSSDGTPESAAAAAGSLPIRIERLPHAGNRNAARNRGIACSRGTRIAFLDGDIVPRPGFLKAHASFGDGATVAVAPRLNLPPLPEDPAFRELLESDIRLLHSVRGGGDERAPHFAHVPLERQPHPWRFLHSHNFSAPARALRECGGFDEAMSAWGADDLELGWRLWKSGLRFRLAEEAGGAHLFHPPSSRQSTYEGNLARFLRKSPHPAVELLFAETGLPPEDAHAAYSAVDGLPGPEPAAALPEEVRAGAGRVLSNGIAMRGASLEPGIGLRPPGEGMPADLYVVSGRLAALGPAAFARILEEGRRRAPRTFVLDPGRRAEPAFRRLARRHPGFVHRRIGDWVGLDWEGPRPPARVVFHLNNAADTMLRNHQLSLLCEAGERGERHWLCVRDAGSRGPVDGFLDCHAPDEGPEATALRGPAFVFHPPWLKAEVSRNPDALSVFWEDEPAWNRESVRRVSGAYDVVLLKSEAHREIFRSLDPAGRFSATLEPCLDERHFHPGGDTGAGPERFVVGFASKYSNYGSGYDLLLRAFAEGFGDEEGIELRMVLGPVHGIRFRNPWLDPRHSRLLEEWNRLQERASHWFAESELDDLRAATGKRLANVSVVRINPGAPRLGEMLRGTHLYVDPSRFPFARSLTLCALACGARTAVPDHCGVFGFLERGRARFLPTTPVLGDFLGIQAAPLGGGNVPDRTLACVARELEPAPLVEFIRAEFEAWKRGRFRKDREAAAAISRSQSRGAVLARLSGILDEARGQGAAARTPALTP